MTARRKPNKTEPPEAGRSPGGEADRLLHIHCAVVERILCGFIENELRRAGFQRVVLGVSGGIDSSLVAALAARALGPKNVCGIQMPYRTSSEETARHGRQIIEMLGIDSVTAPITEAVDAYFSRFPDASTLRRANKMARERMATLYDHSAAQQALVLGTSNKSELLLGYGTQFGDMASALNPIGDLYKTQVRQLARHVGIPAEIVEKCPTGDLWVGQTDEAELGFTYEMVDRLLVLLVDLRYRPAEAMAAGFDAPSVTRVRDMVQRSHYKRRLPLIAKVSNRTVDRDFRYARDWGT